MAFTAIGVAVRRAALGKGCHILKDGASTDQISIWIVFILEADFDGIPVFARHLATIAANTVAVDGERQGGGHSCGCSVQ